MFSLYNEDTGELTPVKSKGLTIEEQEALLGLIQIAKVTRERVIDKAKRHLENESLGMALHFIQLAQDMGGDIATMTRLHCDTTDTVVACLFPENTRHAIEGPRKPR